MGALPTSFAKPQSRKAPSARYKGLYLIICFIISHLEPGYFSFRSDRWSCVFRQRWLNEPCAAAARAAEASPLTWLQVFASPAAPGYLGTTQDPWGEVAGGSALAHPGMGQ